MKNINRLTLYIFLLLIIAGYGCQKKDKVPVLSTDAITNITSHSAISGGNITDEGFDPVIARGLCWSKSYPPTIDNDKTEDGQGAGIFTDSITGLDGGTTYAARAYATNSAGTGYGETLIFATTGITQLEHTQINNYIANNTDLNFQLKNSGLYYLELTTGTGVSLVTDDVAYVKYTGKFLNGKVFDTNVGTSDTLVFPLNRETVISGLNEGVSYMNVGGKALLLIPSNLAFGEGGYYYVVPGNTPILFEVDLVRAVKR
jgi:hypothetical protein